MLELTGAIMIKDLISIANKLDKSGLTKEADILDRLLAKTSQMAEEQEEEVLNNPVEKIISGVTSAIEGLNEIGATEDVDEDLSALNKILEKYLS